MPMPFVAIVFDGFNFAMPYRQRQTAAFGDFRLGGGCAAGFCQVENLCSQTLQGVA